jgi:hypothetical protein
MANKGLELTASSVRSAPASSRSSGPALGFEGKGHGARSDRGLSELV